MALSLLPVSKPYYLFCWWQAPLRWGHERRAALGYDFVVLCDVVTALFYSFLCSWSTLLWKGLAGILLAHCVLFVTGVGRKSFFKETL